MTVFAWGWLILALLFLSLIAVRWHGTAICRSLDSAETLAITTDEVTACVDVIIPAYNEADNIESCVIAALDSMAGVKAQLWVADDQSTDDTFAIAQGLAQKDSRVQVFQVPPRPAQELWLGKNWACQQVAKKSQADYLLFIDADVTLGADVLKGALQEAQHSQVDLLSVFPSVICRIWAEWLVQSLILGIIVGFCDFKDINDPECPNTVFGSGQFMLFHRDAYEKIGGHASVAGNPLEDVALARRIKQMSMRLKVMLAGGLYTVRMYPTFAALWEGWSKNLHWSFGRRVPISLLVAWLVLGVWSVPQLSLIGAIAFLCEGWSIQSLWTLVQGGLMLGMSLILQIWMFKIRKNLAKSFTEPLKYGSLSFLGGILVAAITIVSIIKTETGWGWTWRGRSLVGAHAISTPNLAD